MKTLPLSAGLLGTCFIATIAAQAQTYSTEAVTVTGSLENEIPQLLQHSGTQVDTIGATAIRNGGYTDIAQTLQAEAPGLYIAGRQGAFDYVDVSLLGSRSQDVLWLVDGVRVNNRLYAGTTPLDTLPAAIVDRIEVLQGGQGLFYGTHAVAGAVNIITKGFSSTPDGAVTIGGNSQYDGHVDGYFRNSALGGQFVVYASADTGDHFRPYSLADFQPSETLRSRGYQVYAGGTKYQYAVGPGLALNFAYEKNLAHLDYPSPQDVNTAFNQRSEDLLTAKLDYTASDTVQFYVKSYYHWWTSHYTELDNDPASPGGIAVEDLHDHWGYVDRGINAMAQIRFVPGLQSVLGYDYQNYNGNDAVLVIAPQSEQVHALFGQLETTDLISNAHLALGARYNSPSVGEDAFVWNASGRYDFSDAFYATGTLGTNFRLPSAEELFANDPDDERGNPGLKPERSISANTSLGGQVNLGPTRLDWRLTGFYREIKDLIDYDTFDAATDQDVFGNVAGKVITRGMEATLNAPVSDDLSGNLDFTYAAARQSGSTAQFARIPETLFKAGLDYHPATLPFGVSATVQYVGTLHDSLGGGIGHAGYGNYALVNFGARWFLDDARRHRLGVNLNNAFDQEYATHLIRGTEDVSGDSYRVDERGLPRTVAVNYTFSL